MKVKDMVRFSANRAVQENGPVTVKNRHITFNKVELVELINQKPGMSYAELAQVLAQPYQATDLDRRLISSRLVMLVKQTKPAIKRIEADGMFRYYPINYKLSTDKVDVEIVPPKRDIPKKSGDVDIEFIPKSIESLIKDYVWETEANSAPFKEFLQWLHK